MLFSGCGLRIVSLSKVKERGWKEYGACASAAHCYERPKYSCGSVHIVFSGKTDYSWEDSPSVRGDRLRGTKPDDVVVERS